MAYATRRSLYLLLILLALATEDSHAQSFVPTGNMSTRRVGHSATLLQDGRVLVAGGRTGYAPSPSGVPGRLYPQNTSTAEIYDPATGAFAETGAMSAVRASHAAVLLQDGRVLIVGGDSCIPNSCISASAELYDPATGTFTSVGNTSVTRYVNSAVLLKNGKVLVGGSSTIELFDPAQGTFTPLNNVSGSAMALLSDGEVLLNTWSELLLYDPAKNGFRQLPFSWNLLFGSTATPLLDGSIFLAGGDPDYFADHASARTYVYDPATQILKTAANLLLPRESHTATLLKDGRVLITGGYNEEGGDSTNLADAELYDPTTGTLSRTRDMLLHRFEHVATLLRDGRVLITGGLASGSERSFYAEASSAEIFVPESTQGFVPRLELDSTRYCAGDSGTLRAESIAPLSSVQISGTRDGSPWTISDWKTSGEDGTIVATETYDSSAAGNYTVWLYAGGKTSNTASVTVESCSVHLDLMNSQSPTLQTDFYMGDSWTAHVTSSLPGTNVKLTGISQGTPWTIESWGRTGSDGSFTATGTFLFGSDGVHALRVIVGSAQSNQVRFRVIDY